MLVMQTFIYLFIYRAYICDIQALSHKMYPSYAMTRIDNKLEFNFPKLISLPCFHHILICTVTAYNKANSINKSFVAGAVLSMVLIVLDCSFVYLIIYLFTSLTAIDSGWISTFTTSVFAATKMQVCLPSATQEFIICSNLVWAMTRWTWLKSPGQDELIQQSPMIAWIQFHCLQLLLASNFAVCHFALQCRFFLLFFSFHHRMCHSHVFQYCDIDKLFTPPAMQSLVARVKENLEKLTEERDQRSSSENREKEQNKRLQRQIRDIKEEMGELAKKETEASRKKHELVPMRLRSLLFQLQWDALACSHPPVFTGNGHWKLGGGQSEPAGGP